MKKTWTINEEDYVWKIKEEDRKTYKDAQAVLVKQIHHYLTKEPDTKHSVKIITMRAHKHIS